MTEASGVRRVGSLENDSASRLLHLALAPAVQPADILLEHALAQRDPSWVYAALDRIARETATSRPNPGAWIRTRPDADQIVSLRVRAKIAFEASPTIAARCEALFVYAYAVAASILHTGSTGSAERRDAIDALLGAAAAAAPAEVREFLERALATETAE
jgi:hypothetical protein